MKSKQFELEWFLGNVEGLERKSQPEYERWFIVNENKKELGWFKMTEKNAFPQLIDTIK
jgi:hypothetical protein